jgi:hypothetical protein
MKHSLIAFLIAAAMGTGVALADNPPTNDQMTGNQSAKTPDQQKWMKECMTKARASNTGMSEQDMKKACMDQLKTNMGTPTEPVTPAQ